MIPGLERSPGEGKGYPLQYSGLKNSMDCTVHGVAKSWTQLSDFHSLTHSLKSSQLFCVNLIRILIQRNKLQKPLNRTIVCVLSCFSYVRLSTILWTIAYQAFLSRGLSRQEYWGGLPCLPPGDLPNPGIEPSFLAVSYIGRWVLYH